MFNLAKLLEGMTPMGWAIAVLFLLMWIAMIHIFGKMTAKRCGDRESGALVGFFVPGLIFIGMLYMM